MRLNQVGLQQLLILAQIRSNKQLYPTLNHSGLIHASKAPSLTTKVSEGDIYFDEEEDLLRKHMPLRK